MRAIIAAVLVAGLLGAGVWWQRRTPPVDRTDVRAAQRAADAAAESVYAKCKRRVAAWRVICDNACRARRVPDATGDCSAECVMDEILDNAECDDEYRPHATWHPLRSGWWRQ